MGQTYEERTYELNDIIATMIGWLVSTILNIIWII